MYYIFDETNKKFEKCPNAKPVFLKGHEGFIFILHRPLIGKDGMFSKTGWSLSDATTGCSITTWAESQSEVIANAIEKLSDKTSLMMKEVIVKHIKNNGISPYFSNAIQKEND